MFNCDNELDNTYKKFFKHASNGLTHNLILWIISKETIHGYGIMKKLDEFTEFDDNFKANSSKVYPILKKMEKNGLITGEWKINENNKQVKYYSITDKGLVLIKHIQLHFSKIRSNPLWVEFIKDMSGVNINNEKCN